MFTLTQKIECVKREVKRRERMYPHLVKEGKLSENDAISELIVMQEVLETLTQLKGLIGEL